MSTPFPDQPPTNPQTNGSPYSTSQSASGPQYGNGSYGNGQYPPNGYPQQQPYGGPGATDQRSRVAAGVLGILLGSLGVHNFYLGKIGIAVAQLLITVLSLGVLSFVSGVWGLIEGILILTGSPNYRTDGRGIPLRD
ncbi:TM2 domain-containing protein [Pseudoclavibacter soli]|uniref:TM2 domain-containing protein n=1 Tax=Pseudoclavibacter soli TaxID=452623 RepID=UPI000415508A|nr:TM2 domain-containing protein [Pseudoclavibacter soli]